MLNSFHLHAVFNTYTNQQQLVAVFRLKYVQRNDDDISLLTHDKRKCYNNVKHCKPNTVNEKNERKQNKLRGIKKICKGYLGKWEGYNGDLWDVSQGGAFLVEADVRGNGNDIVY